MSKTGADRARERFGANMGASIRRDRPGSSGAAPSSAPAAAANRYQGIARIKGGLVLPLDRIIPDPDQPRKHFEPEALERMAQSLRQRGQLMPIRVRQDPESDRWIILAGERRWRGAQIAGLATLEAVEHSGDLSDEEKLDLQLVENCVREDLEPIERAQAFRSYMERRGWSARQLAEHLHLSPSTVIRSLQVLELPEDLQQSIASGEMPPATAIAIQRIEDPSEREQLTEQARAGRLSSQQARQRAADQPRATRASFAVQGGVVTVRLEQPDAPHAEILAALQAAIRKARGSAAA